MKKAFFLLTGAVLLFAAGCQTAAEKKGTFATLPKDHPLPGLVREASPGQLEAYFRSSGLSADSRSFLGVPVLVLAAARGEPAIARFLLEKGADKEAADLNGCRALHAASSCGHTEAVTLLLKYGADINAPGSYGRTPLMEAARLARKNVAGLLLEKGADPNRTDRKGRTALMLGAASSADDPALLELLLKHGAAREMTDKEGQNALMYAAGNGNARNAAFFMKDIPDFTGERQVMGLLILKCAIDGKNPELVKTLIAKKVPLNWEQTFTHETLKRIKMHGLYRILVRRGVLDNRRSPLMWAAKNNDITLIKILLQAGADPLQKDENGNTAYDLATEREAISLLKKAENSKNQKLSKKRKKPLFRSRMFY